MKSKKYKFFKTILFALLFFLSVFIFYPSDNTRATNHLKTPTRQNGYNRTAAIKYAYKWTKNGGIKRNPVYPDFLLDCTNFASQVARAGGIPFKGTGGCKDENTQLEWYIQKSAWYCFTCKWAWAKPWTVVKDFWQYHTLFANNASYYIFTDQEIKKLKKIAKPGDFIQLQYELGGNKFHSMVITKKNTKDLYLTYHTSSDGSDKVDMPLEKIRKKYYKYWLIIFK